MRLTRPLHTLATFRRTRTTYQSPLLRRVASVAPGVLAIEGEGVRAQLARLRAGWCWLALYRLLLPVIRVPLSGAPEGEMLAQHLRIRERGRLRFRSAQGVLVLPPTYADYLRGRHRQAVRTNIRRAAERGYTLFTYRHDAWRLDPRDPRSATVTATAALEVWGVNSAEGEHIGNALLTVDDRTALLHMATSESTYARWLLHSAIVERLCGRCDLLITNTDDVMLISEGSRHYQKLLGYSIVRLSLGLDLADRLRRPWVRRLALCLGGAGTIVAGRLLLPHAAFAAHAALWLATLLAVRRASYRAGAAALTALLAAVALTVLTGFSHPGRAAGFVLAGVSLDLLLATVPRLTWSSFTVMPAGVLGALVALAGTEAGSLAASGPGDWLWAGLCGGLAAGLGWSCGGLLLRFNPAAVAAVPPAGTPGEPRATTGTAGHPGHISEPVAVGLPQL